MMTRKRLAVRCGLFLLGSWLLLCAVIGVGALEGALHPGRRVLQAGDAMVAGQIAAENEAELSDVAIAGADGVTLRAWSIRPREGNGDAVILLHGQADNRAGMLGVAEMLLRHGFAVLLPDARAHGKSGGAIATYGWLEAGDIEQWVHWVERTEAPRCIDGLGDSMGGAELLSSLRAGTRFCAVIAESTFSSFRWAAYERLGQAFHTGTWLGRSVLRPAVETALVYARLRYGAHLEEVSPLRAVVSSGVPVMLIHGLADTNLGPDNSERIRGASSRVELWEPVGADHCGASSAAPEEYERRVVDWFTSHDLH